MFLVEYQGLPTAHHQAVGTRMHQEVLPTLESLEETKSEMAEGAERREGRRW